MTTNHLSFDALRRAMPWLLCTAIACAVLAPASRAAIVINPGGPRPQVLFNLFSIPGVYGTGSLAGSGFLETEFFCTSLETTDTIHMGVQLRNFDGTVVNTGKSGEIDLAPGQTATIGTNDAIAFAEDQVLTLKHVAEVGSARIFANSMKLMCAAVLFQNDGAPPSSMVELKVIKANFQTGD
jgi:hypothetical protein